MFSNFSRHGSSWIDTPTCKTCKMPPDVRFLMTCRHRHVRNFQKSSKIMKINIFWRCLQFGLQLRSSAGPSISIPDQGSNLRSIYRFNPSKRGKVFQVSTIQCTLFLPKYRVLSRQPGLPDDPDSKSVAIGPDPAQIGSRTFLTFLLTYRRRCNAKCTKPHQFGHSMRPGTLFREGAKCCISYAKI